MADNDLSYLQPVVGDQPQHFPFVDMSLYTGIDNSVVKAWETLQCQHAPFWAFVWPGGQALARYTLDHPEIFRGKSVIDIGPGTGINSIAAALAGAADVEAFDTEPMSVDLTTLNADLNGVNVNAYSDYFNADMIHHYDIIIMGDCFYDAQASFEINPLVDAAVKAGVPFITGDPMREHFPRRRAKLLEQYSVPDIMKERGQVNTNAYVFELGAN